ncbi:MAG: HAD hydrolase family protein [Bacteroidota bacterium]|nr:HAD hydrolase family protein [Bacteroidota bacterium]
MGHFKTILKNVKAFVFDVDGVFSNNNVYLHPSGDMMRSMNVKDGFAIQQALKYEFPVAIITGGWSESVKIRFNRLGVTDVYLKSKDKLDDMTDFIYKYQLGFESILYMGDDLPDYDAMKKVGIACCPADAAEEIKAVSHYISDRPAGEGCVRDVVEQVLRAQGKWPNHLENEQLTPSG